MDPTQLKQVEALCDTMFNPSAPAEHKNRAQTALMVLGSSAKYIPQCQSILDSSSNQYALYIAATSLTKLISEHWNHFSEPQRVDIRNYILTYLARKGTMLRPFAITALIQLLCRITKLGWFDTDGQLRKVVTQTTTFLKQSVEHCIIGLKILNELVVEFNHRSSRRTITAHRKASVSFRDLSLLYTFEIALTMLRQIMMNSLGVTDPNLEDQVLDQSLKLVINCLSYDFIGTNPDEATDDVGTIQLPLRWRSIVVNPETLKVFFGMYRGCCTGSFQMSAGSAAAAATVGMGAGASTTGTERASITVRPKRAAQVMECLTLLISVRRSIFAKDEQRLTFLLRVVTGLCEVMRDELGMADSDCYHQFCRLLGKIKRVYQLSDLLRTVSYTEWIALAADFAMKSFRNLHAATNSIHYIIGLWSRLVSAAPHVAPEVLAARSPMIGTYAPQVAYGYLEARLNSVEAVLKGEINDDLTDEDLVMQQLEQLPNVCRFKYAALEKQIVAIMDPMLSRFRDLMGMLSAAPNDPTGLAQLQLLEVKLAWIVYYIGAIIGEGCSFYDRSNSTGRELLDADLSRRVLTLMQMLDMRLSSTGGRGKSDWRLELAMLYYVRNFRKAYIGEQHGMPTPGREGKPLVSAKQKKFQSMFERMGLGSHLVVITSIVQKIANNLRFWTDNEDVIKKTLQLFWNLAYTYSSVKLLLTLDAVKHILTHHTEAHFPFLALPSLTRERTTFYTALARVLFMNTDSELFNKFMEPILTVLTNLKTTIHVRSEKVHAAIIGVCRDLRGIVAATNSKKTYGMVFDALYPAHFDLFSKAVLAWADTPAVTTVVLKLMTELATNKGDRIMFGNMSPNGILLFREISKVVCAYASRIVSVTPTVQEYANKYKGISVCLHMISLSLIGGYVQFGVFELYGDKALDNAMQASVQMALCIPLEKVVTHPKVARQFFGFFDVVTRSYIRIIVALGHSAFMDVIKAFQQGLDDIDTTIALHAANSVDSLASYFVRNARKNTREVQMLAAHLQSSPLIFPTFAKSLFNILVFGECKNQWALSRPLLALLLASEVVHKDFKEGFISSQPAEFRPKLTVAFEALMKDVNSTLDLTNRERFTQHMAGFRNTVRGFIKY